MSNGNPTYVERDGVKRPIPSIPDWIEDIDGPVELDGPISKEDAIMMAEQRLAAEASSFIEKANEKILKNYVPAGSLSIYKETKTSVAALKWAAERFKEAGWSVTTYDNRMDIR